MKKNYFIMGGMLLSSFLVLGGCGSSQHSISTPSTPIGPSSTDFHFSGSPTAPSFSFSDVDEGKITDVSVPISLEGFMLPTGATETSTLEIADTTQNIKDDQKLAISPATFDIDKPGSYDANIQLQKNTTAGVHTITFTLKNRGPQGQTYTETTNFTVFDGPKKTYKLALSSDGQNLLLDGDDAIYYSNNGGNTLVKAEGIPAPLKDVHDDHARPVFAFSKNNNVATVALVDKSLGKRKFQIYSSSTLNKGGLQDFGNPEWSGDIDDNSNYEPFSLSLSDDGLTGILTVNNINDVGSNTLAFIGVFDHKIGGAHKAWYGHITYEKSRKHPDVNGPEGLNVFTSISGNGRAAALSDSFGHVFYSANGKDEIALNTTFKLGGDIDNVSDFLPTMQSNQMLAFSGSNDNLTLVWSHFSTTDNKNHLYYSDSSRSFGKNFTSATTNSPDSLNIKGFASSSTSNNVIAITNDSVWYSTDNGNNYKKATLPAEAKDLTLQKVVMNSENGNDVVVMTDNQILYSTDGGATFNLSKGDKVGADAKFVDVAISSDGTQIVAIANNTNGSALLFKSTDSGANFTWTW